MTTALMKVPTLAQRLNEHVLDVAVSQLTSEALLRGLEAFDDYEARQERWGACFVSCAARPHLHPGGVLHWASIVKEHRFALGLYSDHQVRILTMAFDKCPGKLVASVVDELVRRADANRSIQAAVDALLAEGTEVPV